jgi:glycosyltransferase involved in cell wall biosynthesis
MSDRTLSTAVPSPAAHSSAHPAQPLTLDAGLRVALVHDWLNQFGGAENVLEELVGLFPTAPVYTSIYAAEQMPDTYRAWEIHTSFMQRLPAVATHHQPYLPLYPLAFRQMDLSHYDLVLSNKSGFCHGVITANQAAGRKAVHVCYCLTPTRFLWLYEQYRRREQINLGLHMVLQPVLALLRRWDWAAAQRVDHFIAISAEVQTRIAHIYNRDSVVIHPPVDTDYFTPAFHSYAQTEENQAGEEYYLIVSRLIPYKRIDLAVQAFRHLPNARLVIVGEGRDRAGLEAHATPNVQFLGWQPRARIRELMQGCKAFIFPGFEDFGITPVEALAAGRPVIAYRGGGALDTVLPGVTGEFFYPQTPQALLSVVQQFDTTRYTVEACRRQAEEFSVDTFRRKLIDYLASVMQV